MRRLIQISLLLAALSAAALSLSPKDLSSTFFLLPVNSKCAINFGKDSGSGYGPVHSPESFLYDGVRCESHFSDNGTTGFVVGESQTLKDVVAHVRIVGDVVVLQAQVFETGFRHDRMGEMRRRNGVVLCGEKALREALFVKATKNGVVKARGSDFRVQKGDLHAFVDDVDPTAKTELRSDNQTRLCFFKGDFGKDDYAADVPPPTVGGGTSFGRDRVGLIVGGVFGIAVLAVVLYGIVFILYRKVREGGDSVAKDSM